MVQLCHLKPQELLEIFTQSQAQQQTEAELVVESCAN